MSIPPGADLAAMFAVGLEHHQSGRLSEAESSYRAILAVDPTHFNALHLLGLIAHHRGDETEAMDLIERALVQDGGAYPAFNSLGIVFQAMGDLEPARKCFEHALTLQPDFPEALGNLAVVLATQGKLEESATRLGQLATLRPDRPATHCDLGRILTELGRFDEAVEAFTRALELDPELAEAHLGLGKVFQAQRRPADALAKYQELVLLKPEFADTHFALGAMLHVQGLIEDALECFGAAVALNPGFVEARWCHAISQLAIVHREGETPAKFRAAFDNSLSELDRWFRGEREIQGCRGVGASQPFYLAYHLQSNRDLLSKYGDLCARLMKRWQDDQKIPMRTRTVGAKIRVGIVSAHVFNQSVWTAFVRGWCEHLDARQFELIIFCLNSNHDGETEFARAHAAQFVDGRRDLRGWVEAIIGQEPDVLIYPEIGMDPLTAKLASMRLCRVQAIAWGHPETSGFPTLDYYLSAEDFEPPGAQANYREKLVALPHLGCCYRALEVPPMNVDLELLGIAPDVPMLVCPGVPFKYAPEHDRTFVEIARRLGRCQFLFFDQSLGNLTEKLQQRLTHVFSEHGMYFDEFAVMLPWLSREAFFGLLQRADVYVDTIGFSGFNTAMQAIQCGLPIATQEGKFMRGRLGSGILKRMGMPELVASNDDEHIELVVKLVQDSAFRRATRERILSSRHVLFDDVVPVRALEEFLVTVARGSSPAVPPVPA
jgi:predicted O-linked N-acetylglucosamine transferase (SPINDLY family)